MAQQHRCECDSNKWKILISHWMVSRQHFSFDSPPLAINEMEKREAHAHTSPQFKTISMSRCDEVIPFEGEIAIRLEQIQLLLAFQDQYNIVPSWLPPSSPLDRIDTVKCTQFSVKLSIYSLRPNLFKYLPLLANGSLKIVAKHFIASDPVVASDAPASPLRLFLPIWTERKNHWFGINLFRFSVVFMQYLLKIFHVHWLNRIVCRQIKSNSVCSGRCAHTRQSQRRTRRTNSSESAALNSIPTFGSLSHSFYDCGRATTIHAKRYLYLFILLNLKASIYPERGYVVCAAQCKCRKQRELNKGRRKSRRETQKSSSSTKLMAHGCDEQNGTCANTNNNNHGVQGKPNAIQTRCWTPKTNKWKTPL